VNSSIYKKNPGLGECNPGSRPSGEIIAGLDPGLGFCVPTSSKNNKAILNKINIATTESIMYVGILLSWFWKLFYWPWLRSAKNGAQVYKINNNYSSQLLNIVNILTVELGCLYANVKVATVLGSISAFFKKVESERRKMKQC
jgi:hypothetical protein